MSTIGTGIAASVANAVTAARAQVTSNSSQDAQRSSSQQQTDKLTLTQLHGAGAARDADQEMPDGQAPGYEELYDGDAQPQEEQDNPNDQIHGDDAPPSSPTNLPLTPTYGPDGKDHPLFHKLDVKA